MPKNLMIIKGRTGSGRTTIAKTIAEQLVRSNRSSRSRIYASNGFILETGLGQSVDEMVVNADFENGLSSLEEKPDLVIFDDALSSHEAVVKRLVVMAGIRTVTIEHGSPFSITIEDDGQTFWFQRMLWINHGKSHDSGAA
ncbi:ATP-binding protein [Acidithiobacillus ferrivorans]|nr:ATP-binding protein [Acidithiobacillus ferrivorans]